jgi:hypothetical protein
MEEAISDFFEDVCHLRQQPDVGKLMAWKKAAYDLRLSATGSCRDVYIEPIVPHRNVIEMMLFSHEYLAVPSEDDTPRCLPLPFSDTVFVSLMTNIEFTCHVKLLVIGQLRKRLTGRGFTLSNIPPNSSFYLHGSMCESSVNLKRGDSGPARAVSVDCGFTIVTIPTVRCLVWPTQAAEWVERRRDHGWPDNATVERVVGNGCDLVSAYKLRPHMHSTFEDEFIWRFSFFRAETELLNSWTSKQHTVYELFRFVVKKSEAFSLWDGLGRKILRTRHLKTLMMWACELHDSYWWIRSNVVRLVVFLMRSLLNCREKSFCRGYFISEENLFKGCASESLVDRIRSFIDATALSEWLINNYIRPQLKNGPDNIRCLFDDVGTIATLRSATKALKEWKQHKLLEESFDGMRVVLSSMCGFFCDELPALNEMLIKKWQKDIAEVDERLVPAFLTPLLCLSMLRTVRSTTKHVNAGTADILTAALTNYDESDVTTSMTTESTGIILLRKAIGLLRRSVDASSDTTRSIFFELSHSYLRHARKHFDAVDNRSQRAVDCYLAVLYHVTGHHQKAIRRCIRVIGSRQDDNFSHGTCAIVIEGRCMPRVSREVDIARGLALLYERLRRKYLEGRSDCLLPHHVDVFAVGLFAHHLMLSSGAATTGYSDKSVRAIIQRYRNRFGREPHIFVTDLLLFFASDVKNRSCPDARRTSSNRFSSSLFTGGSLHQLVVTYSVDQLTVLIEVLSRDFGSEFPVATNEYRATDAYRRGMYETCLEMNDNEVFETLSNAHHHFRAPMFGCMTHLMDDNMVSILALRNLQAPNDDFDGDIHQVTVVLYLTLASELKLNLPVWSMTERLRSVCSLYERHSAGNIFDRLLLSFIYRKAILTMCYRQSQNWLQSDTGSLMSSIG